MRISLSLVPAQSRGEGRARQQLTTRWPGYTGRHLTKYIHDNKLASEIRIVDKNLPELAWLAPEFKEACSRERFIQADASQERAYPGRCHMAAT